MDHEKFTRRCFLAFGTAGLVLSLAYSWAVTVVWGWKDSASLFQAFVILVFVSWTLPYFVITLVKMNYGIKLSSDTANSLHALQQDLIKEMKAMRNAFEKSVPIGTPVAKTKKELLTAMIPSDPHGLGGMEL